MPKYVVFRTISTIKDEKSATKFHYIKTVSGKVVAQSIAFSSGIHMLAGGSSVPLISARKETEPPLEASAFHTLRLIARQPPISVTSLSSAHWLASDFHSWVNS